MDVLQLAYQRIQLETSLSCACLEISYRTTTRLTELTEETSSELKNRLNTVEGIIRTKPMQVF